jgi:hypothetical protein
MYGGIECLPFDTEHFITYEVEGSSFYFIKFNKKVYTFNKFNSDIELNINEIFDTYKIEYILNKYSEYIFEFKYYNNELYIVNIFNKNEILTYNDLEKISKIYDIKIPKKVNIELYKFGNKMIDYFYNDYYINNDVFSKNRKCFLTFKFKNGKYLLYKM